MPRRISTSNWSLLEDGDDDVDEDKECEDKEVEEDPDEMDDADDMCEEVAAENMDPASPLVPAESKTDCCKTNPPLLG